MKTRNLALTMLAIGFVFSSQQLSPGEKIVAKHITRIKRLNAQCSMLIASHYGEKILQGCNEVAQKQGYLDAGWQAYRATIGKEKNVGCIILGTSENDISTHRRIFATPSQVYYDCKKFTSLDGKWSVFRKGDNSETFWHVRNLETDKEEMINNGSFCHGCYLVGEESVFRGWSSNGGYMLFLEFSRDENDAEQVSHIAGSLAIYSVNGLIMDQGTWKLGQIDIKNCDWQDNSANEVIYQYSVKNDPSIKTSIYSAGKSDYMKKAVQIYELVESNMPKIKETIQKEWAKLYPQVSAPDNFGYYWYPGSNVNDEPVVIGFEGYRQFQGQGYPICAEFDLNLDIVRVAKENSG